LRELGQEAGESGRLAHSRIVRRINAMLVDPALSDATKERALGLLADLRAPVPERVLLRDPDSILERSVRELLGSLGSDDSLVQALDMVFEQVPAGELETFLCELVRLGGEAAQPLLSALLTDSRTPRFLANQLLQWVRPAPPAVSTVRRASSRPRMQRALRLLSQGQLSLAHDELQSLTLQRRDDPAVCSALGLCLMRLGRPVQALLPLGRALALAPTVAAHAWNAAVAAHLAERPGSCYHGLKQYLSLDDDRDGAAERQQAASRLCGEFERLAAEVYPGIALSRVLEGEELFVGAYAALRDARYQAAIAGFAAVLERLPTHPASWRNLGFAYLAQRRPREAARCFSRLLRIDASQRLARTNLDL
jgi:Flp pilus assembly protein TadD